MSPASQLTRYRPVVVALTVGAAAYGIWTLWSASTPSRPLHRSSAVRRPRRVAAPVSADRLFNVDYHVESEECPLGGVTWMQEMGVLHIFEIGNEPLPDAYRLGATLECDGEALRDTIASQAVWCILTAARASRGNMSVERSVAIANLGVSLTDVLDALDRHDAAALARAQAQISGLLGGVQDWTILEGFQAFPAFQNYLTGQRRIPEDPPAEDVGETEQSPSDTLGDVDVEPNHGLKGMLYFIAEENAKRAAYEHRGITCEECSESPIKNIRWHCLNCPDFDLCSTCEASTLHNKTHLFVKIKIPMPVLAQPSSPLPVWYPGDPTVPHNRLSQNVTKRLADSHHLDHHQIEALFDQFTSIANTHSHDDPSGVNIAIDRHAFDQALTCDRWTNRYAPNPIYDRMFDFYDTRSKGFIFFEDFVDGISYLRGPHRYTPLSRALRGFDVDGNMCLDRADFLALLRAKYSLSRNINTSASLLKEAEKTQLVTDVLRSSQPISSIFADEPIPLGGPGSRGGKHRNSAGDMEPTEDTNTVLEDGDRPSRASSGSSPPVINAPWRETSLSRLDDALQGAENTAADASPEGRTDPRATPFTTEEATVLGLTGRNASKRQAAPDAMWHIVEESLHEMLDPLFKIRELLDQDVMDTVEERQKWREEIDERMRQNRRFEQSLQTGANADPLMATALDSHAQNAAVQHAEEQTQRQQEVAANLREGMVPTDPDSLDRLESEIHGQPLEELLDASGYSVAEAEEPSSTTSATNAPPTLTLSPPDSDPTLPHNRPNGGPVVPNGAPGTQHPAPPKEPDSPPSPDRLEQLAQFDREEATIKARGGPGRMSFDEIEAVVAADGSKQLKGLVTSWLEWASF